MKTSNAKRIAEAIRETLKGQTVLEPEVTTKMMQRMRAGNETMPHEELTERELEVLLLIAKEKQTKTSQMSYLLH